MCPKQLLGYFQTIKECSLGIYFAFSPHKTASLKILLASAVRLIGISFYSQF
jgi:hypothetical protein